MTALMLTLFGLGFGGFIIYMELSYGWYQSSNIGCLSLICGIVIFLSGVAGLVVLLSGG